MIVNFTNGLHIGLWHTSLNFKSLHTISEMLNLSYIDGERRKKVMLFTFSRYYVYINQFNIKWMQVCLNLKVVSAELPIVSLIWSSVYHHCKYLSTHKSFPLHPKIIFKLHILLIQYSLYTFI